jgi:hypothetical protein
MDAAAQSFVQNETTLLTFLTGRVSGSSFRATRDLQTRALVDSAIALYPICRQRWRHAPQPPDCPSRRCSNKGKNRHSRTCYPERLARRRMTCVLKK